MKLSHLPLRWTIGGFILNSGLTKRDVDPDMAKGMHAMAAGAIPQLAQLEPEQFGRYLSMGEMALGAALIAPFVPSVVAGAALTAFGAGLLALYVKTPGMHEPGSLRPTQQGTGIAKDVWLVGAGLTLVLDGLSGD
ncbi:MAG TPA: hypothetical protein VGD11_15725 [Mycobacteriales bacterium]|jgi:hypothetical protein